MASSCCIVVAFCHTHTHTQRVLPDLGHNLNTLPYTETALNKIQRCIHENRTTCIQSKIMEK